MTYQHSKLLACGLMLTLGSSTIARADDPVSKFASGAGNIIYLATGTLASLIEDGTDAKEHTLRTVDSLGTTLLLTEALKSTIHEKRPRSNARDSFPSGHTAAAFSVATMQSAFHPNQAPYWYAGAALIGVSRVTLHHHYVHDVIAGAALGYFTSKLELHAKHGLILSPIIRSTQNNKGKVASNLGVGLSGTF